MDNAEIYKELKRLSALNGWGFLGIFIPIVGFILYGIVIARANTLLTFTESNRTETIGKEIIKRRTNSIGMLSLIIILTIFYILLGFNLSQTGGNSSYQSTSSTTESHNQAALAECIDNVNVWFDTNRTSTETVLQEQNLLTEKQQKIDECKLLYIVQ